MNTRQLGYGVLFLSLVAFGLLWWELGDPVGAVLSLFVLLLGAGLLVAVIGYFASNLPYWLRHIRGVSWEDHLKQLETDGKATRDEYRAVGAVTVEDQNTGSLIHFVELDDGRILCLYGQYYYDFEPIEDDPEVNQTRKFPTKTFSVLRNTKTGEVLRLLPRPDVFEPIVCDPIAKLEKLFDLGFELKDGEIVTGTSLAAVQSAVEAAR